MHRPIMGTGWRGAAPGYGNGANMLKTKSTLLQSAVLALTLALPVTGGALFVPAPAMAAATLPAPYVSRALDAVLMPVDGSVIDAFGLAAGSTGVLVVATDPAGLAASAGIEPGDVIDYVKGKAVLSPAELDEIVYYWITQGAFDFDLGTVRAGAPVTLTTTITMEAWESVIDITTVESWSSYSSESFSYSEYYSEYSEEMTASYESSEASIEEAVSSEEFQSDMSAEGGDAAAEDTGGDEAAADEGGDAGGDEGGDAGGDEGGDAGGEEPTE